MDSVIYKRFQMNKQKPVSEMKGLQWFSFSPDYGESYGPIVHTFKFKRQPNLLDIGKTNIRAQLIATIAPLYSEFVILSDPDEQYSGGSSNKKYHELVKKFFGKDYDGTIINEVDDPNLEGAKEIVLWKNFSRLIKEL